VSRRLLIRGGAIVSLDPAVGTLRCGDLLAEEGVIVAIAPNIEADAEILDAKGQVVMPGLIDSHRHLWYETIRGIAVDAVLSDLRTDIWPNLAVRYTPEDVNVATRAGIVEALNNGVTTVLDWCHIINTPEHGQEAIRAHRELPIRSVFAYGAPMTQKLGELEGRSGEKAARAELAKLVPGSRMTFALALQGPESASMQITEQEIALARELDLPVTMHVGMQNGAPPRRSIAGLAEAGLLGADMQFVHGCSTGDDELRQLEAAGATIVICPTAEMALAIGVPPTGRAREAGLRPAFGADAVCSASGDMFDEARLALLAERCLRAQPIFEAERDVQKEDLVLTAADAIEGITVNGARACWLEGRVGSLTIGRLADVVVLSELDLSVASLGDIRATVVSSAHGSSVEAARLERRCRARCRARVDGARGRRGRRREGRAQPGAGRDAARPRGRVDDARWSARAGAPPADPLGRRHARAAGRDVRVLRRSRSADAGGDGPDARRRVHAEVRARR
jgi:5-methylthioadenosine/S-adenosylhomocysteine deaminase